MNLNPVSDERLPVTLLTGFLGAGKTTVLNGLLRSPGQDQIAVIVNEFGAAGLDHDLMEAVDEEIVLMQSGCLCCSVRGDLARVLSDLLECRAEGRVQFDRVVIETTGLADPGPIVQTLQVEPVLERMVRLDGIVTVADAATGPGTLDRQFEAVSQIAMADLVILSKSDLVTPAAASVDPLANLSGLAAKPPVKAEGSPHDARIGSASIVLDTPIPDVVFELWLDTLVALRGPDLLRVKGLVHIKGLREPFVFHGVQHVFDMPVPVKDWPADDRQSRIVVIARDLTQGRGGLTGSSLDANISPDRIALQEG